MGPCRGPQVRRRLVAEVSSPGAGPAAAPQKTTTTGKHPDGPVVTVVTEELEDPPAWRMLPGIMPCGNHDIFAAVCNGKIYVTGGALWWLDEVGTIVAWSDR